MNKKIAFGIGIVGIATAFVGSVVYIAKSNLEKREKVLSDQISAFKSSLPSEYQFEKTQGESNLFQSTGKYVLTSKDSKDNSSNATISLEYKASHGPKAWFGGEIQFVANGKLEGQIVKTYQILSNKNPGVIFKVEGIIIEDNSIVSKNTINDFSFVVPVPEQDQELISDIENETEINSNTDNISVESASVKTIEKSKNNTDKTGMLVNVKGTNGLFKLNPKTGEVQSSLNYGTITAEDLENTQDKIVAQNLNISYDSNLNSLDIGTFKLNTSSLSDGTDNMKMEGFEFVVATEQKKQKYNMKLNTKVKKLKVMAQTGSFEVGYSINGIDKEMIVLSKKLGQTYASRAELSEEEMKKAKEVILNNLKTGFSFNLDKIYLKNERNQLDFSGQYEVIPTSQNQPFSFQTQSKFGAQLKVSGDMIPMAYSLLGSFLGVQTPEQPQEFQFQIGFENGKLKVNKKEVEQGINESILDVLKTVDSNFGLIPKESTNTSEIDNLIDRESDEIYSNTDTLKKDNESK